MNMTVQHVMAEDLRKPNIHLRVEDITTRLERRLKNTNFGLSMAKVAYVPVEGCTHKQVRANQVDKPHYI